LVFEPTGAVLESLVGNQNALRVPIQIEIARHRPLTTRMWESLFREMAQAALTADMRLYEQAVANAGSRDQDGFQAIIRQTDRFVVTSVSRGSIEITATVLLAAAWVYKNFIEPGWMKSQTKKDWDDTVAGMIDIAIPILKDQIDYRVVHRLKRLKIRRVLFRQPDGEARRLDANTTPDMELVYDKPKQIEHLKKKIP
jgi:hypothetical protein